MPDHSAAPGGAASDRDPAVATMAALLADPGATVYLTDPTSRGLPQAVTPGHAFPGTAAGTTAVVTFADQRPDRHLTSSEVAALARLAAGAPVVGTVGGGTPSRSLSTPVAGSDTAMAGDGQPASPAPSPITLPPPLQYPAHATGRPTTPPVAGEETTA